MEYVSPVSAPGHRPEGANLRTVPAFFEPQNGKNGLETSLRKVPSLRDTRTLRFVSAQPMDDAKLSAHHEQLFARDYNRTKSGLGFGGGGGGEEPAMAAASVASHYNSLHDRHRTLTEGSTILHLRNLNNWIKSVLIGKYLKQNDSVLE